MSKRQELLDLINEKITEAQTDKSEEKPKSRPQRKPATRATRAEVNAGNGKNSTGPRTPAGKEKASANSLKHGYYASLQKLNPRDSLAFHHINATLQDSLHPDGSAETHVVEEIAMLSARLQSLEAAQFALIAGNTEGEPAKIENPETYTDSELYDLRQPDARAVAHAYERCLDTLERLTKIETHLRRAYNLSWDRLQRMQRDREKMPLDETIKRTQARLISEAIKKKRLQDVPAPHPDVDENGKFKQYKRGDPLYRPKEDPDEEKTHDEDDLT